MASYATLNRFEHYPPGFFFGCIKLILFSHLHLRLSLPPQTHKSINFVELYFSSAWMEPILPFTMSLHVFAPLCDRKVCQLFSEPQCVDFSRKTLFISCKLWRVTVVYHVICSCEHKHHFKSARKTSQLKTIKYLWLKAGDIQGCFSVLL